MLNLKFTILSDEQQSGLLRPENLLKSPVPEYIETLNSKLLQESPRFAFSLEDREIIEFNFDAAELNLTDFGLSSFLTFSSSPALKVSNHEGTIDFFSNNLIEQTLKYDGVLLNCFDIQKSNCVFSYIDTVLYVQLFSNNQFNQYELKLNSVPKACDFDGEYFAIAEEDSFVTLGNTQELEEKAKLFSFRSKQKICSLFLEVQQNLIVVGLENGILEFRSLSGDILNTFNFKEILGFESKVLHILASRSEKQQHYMVIIERSPPVLLEGEISQFTVAKAVFNKFPYSLLRFNCLDNATLLNLIISVDLSKRNRHPEEELDYLEQIHESLFANFEFPLKQKEVDLVGAELEVLVRISQEERVESDDFTVFRRILLNLLRFANKQEFERQISTDENRFDEVDIRNPEGSSFEKFVAGRTEFGSNELDELQEAENKIEKELNINIV